MEPAEAVNIIESDLRWIMRAVLKGDYGFTTAFLAELQKRYDSEEEKRRPAKVSSELLDYTHLGELKDLIVKRTNWPSFKDAFLNKDEFSALCAFAGRYRNTVAHSRELLPWERTHLEGIAGVLRAQVTVFMSTKGPDMEYYPAIERITDSFGNSREGLQQLGVVLTETALRVGDIVTFSCRGNDPQGRELTWTLGTSTTRGSTSVVGPEVTLSWEVTEDDVSDSTMVAISLSSAGKYHRSVTYDDRLNFVYKVIPPIE
ncbi:hypothetical protein MUN74_15810 [Agromyces endophyticus]|uniref:hypothetical protein n=1 Tax=Agromyces sp. H17E-10 TaxID=2932244 RepID=UPI001FD368E0|nr:hypothetical protein [Agromyces sp. H17E-10]UOQ88715.1 hypothetical protein MUN74_15810 [Agromyces sp. H17E-10]